MKPPAVPAEQCSRTVIRSCCRLCDVLVLVFPPSKLSSAAAKKNGSYWQEMLVAWQPGRLRYPHRDEHEERVTTTSCCIF